MNKNNNRRWGGRALILATLLAVCAALVPSSASAALPKKVVGNNDFTIASCSFTVEKTDAVAGTAQIKITAAARPKGFSGFKNVQTDVVCYVTDPAHTFAWDYKVFTAKNNINQVARVTVPLAGVGNYCIYTETEQKSGAIDDAFVCVP